MRIGSGIREYDPGAYRFDGLATPEYRIGYEGGDGTLTSRDIYVHRWYEAKGVTFYEGWCFLRDEKRTFRSDRIRSIVNLATGRRIADIAAHRLR